MKLRKMLVAGTTAIAILAPAGNVLASTGDASSGTQATDTSTTVPLRRDAAKATQFRAEMAAWQEAMRAWLNGRAAAMKDHRESVAGASATLKTELAAASTKEARKAAMDTFKSSRQAAKADLEAALATLGERPVRPTR